MVKIDVASTAFSIQSQRYNCNINITLGSQSAPANINIYGDTFLYRDTFNISNISFSNIGIGTDIPSYRMHIYSTSSTNNNYEYGGIMLENNSLGELGIGFRNSNTSDNTWTLGMNNSTLTNSSNVLSFNYDNQGNQFSPEGLKMSFMSTGPVGIRSSQSPNTKGYLQYNGNTRIYIPYASNTGLRFIRESDNEILGSLLPDMATGDLIVKNIDGGIFFRGNDQSSYITSVGGILLYSQTQPLPAPENGMSFQVNTRFEGNVGIGITTPTQRLCISDNVYVAPSGNVGIGTNNNSFQLQLLDDYAFKPTTNTWGVTSDERLKKDIVEADLNMCWENIKKIPLKKYIWQPDFYTSNNVLHQTKIGWIAQDVEPIFPKSIITQNLYNLQDCKLLNTDQLYASMYGALQLAIKKLNNIDDNINKLVNKV